jgi:hypothetical protein
VPQPRIKDLLRGRVSRFSLDALVNISTALGCRGNGTPPPPAGTRACGQRTSLANFQLHRARVRSRVRPAVGADDESRQRRPNGFSRQADRGERQETAAGKPGRQRAGIHRFGGPVETGDLLEGEDAFLGGGRDQEDPKTTPESKHGCWEP